jgi:hypothetical protein
MEDAMEDGGRREHQFRLVLDKEDWELLIRLSKEEKLSKSEILRRAIRFYKPTFRRSDISKIAVNG